MGRLIIILICLSNCVFSQKDSLLSAIKKCSVKDSALICNKLSINYRFSDGDSALYFAELALKTSISTNNIKEQANAENSIGVQNHLLAKYDVAMQHYLKSVKLFEKINFPKGIASATQNIGIIYFDQGNLQVALKYYMQSAELYKKAAHQKGLSSIYNNIAAIHISLNNPIKGLEYHSLALGIRLQIGDSALIASSYGGIAVAYFHLKDYKKAIEYNEKELRLQIFYDNKREIATTYNNLGDAYLELGNLEQAKNCFAKGLEVATQSEDYYALNDLYYNLSIVHERTENFKESYYAFKKYASVHDSIFKSETSDKFIEMDAKYQTEKKELQIKNQTTEIAAKEKENRNQKIIITLGSVALLGIGFFGTVAFINYKKTQKAKKIIEEKNQLVEAKNTEISLQKDLVEEKQKEIIDSINYAKRIQTAVLSDTSTWNKISTEHFILFKPKDIVSGDFYWAYNTPNNRSIFLLADCTGHGVPGGFMSMLGNSLLNEIIVENKIFKADAILNKLREKIKSALHQGENIEQKDGMDISLCIWNKLDNTLEFAGANNPLWLLRDNEIIEYKADKMPIGAYVNDTTPFACQTIQLQQNDCIYLITDGFADQFGGPKGKKFKYKPLMELLIANHTKPMDEQKTILNATIEDWKKGFEQVDDVSLVGIKV